MNYDAELRICAMGHITATWLADVIDDGEGAEEEEEEEDEYEDEDEEEDEDALDLAGW
jgi:hypothetical protein